MMMNQHNPFVIEQAKHEDASAIAKLQIASLRASHKAFFPPHLHRLVLPPNDVVPNGKAWLGWLKRANAYTAVSRHQTILTGFTTIHKKKGDESLAEIAAYFVHPEYWRQGIGLQLWTHLCEESTSLEIQKFVVWVLDNNQRAKQFYASLGFKSNGNTRTFLEHGAETINEIQLSCLLKVDG